MRLMRRYSEGTCGGCTKMAEKIGGSYFQIPSKMFNVLEKIKIADEILKGRDDFAHYNAETIEAIEECERILKDPTVKGYNSIEELKEALKND